MSAKAIAVRYATALLEEAVARGLDATVERDIVTITEIADASPDLRMLLRSPIIEWWRKKSIIIEILQGRVNELSLNFMILVIEKGRERFFREIAASYLEMLDQRRNILRVSVESAVALDEQARTEVVDRLSTRNGKTVMATFDVEPTLIGGLRVTIGDNVFDSSLQSQLEDLRERLETASDN